MILRQDVSYKLANVSIGISQFPLNREKTMRRYLLVNDTSGTNNPGCQGTVACLRWLLRKRNLIEVGSFPINFGAELFQECKRTFLPRVAARLARRWRKGPPHAPWSDEHSGAVHLNKWEAAKAALLERIRDRIGAVDTIIINGEGTIHHNRPSGLALLAIAELAAERGVHVEIVNATIQDMDPQLLVRVMRKCARAIVREPLSKSYLADIGIDAELVPDCLFVHSPGSMAGPTVRDSVAYTPGVLSLTGYFNERDVYEQMAEMKRAGKHVTYIGVENGDQIGFEPAKKLHIPVSPVGAVKWTQFAPLLQKFELVVSGRYHVNIFALLANRKVVCLPSNTWKIEGLLALFNSNRKDTREPVRSDVGALPFMVSNVTLNWLRKWVNEAYCPHDQAEVERWPKTKHSA